MMRRSIYITFSFLAVLAACKKEAVEKNPIPEIRIMKVAPTTVKQFEEKVTITIGYKDEDGDLGFLDADVTSLEVQDSRLTTPDKYHIPPLSPIGSNVDIEGEIDIELNSPFLLGNGDEEKIIYSIRIIDRNGNWSNVVKTSEITVVK